MVKKSKEKRPRARKSVKNTNSNTWLQKYNLALMSILALLLVGFGFYFYTTTPSKPQQKVVQKEQTISNEALMKKMKKMLDEEKVRQAVSDLNTTAKPQAGIVAKPIDKNITHEKQELAKKQLSDKNITVEPYVKRTKENEPHVFPSNGHGAHHDRSEALEYEKSIQAGEKPHKPSDVIRKRYPAGTTPKLAIIIDDVSFPWQARMIKEIPYKVTPAFFPPTKGHPETVRLSKEFEFAMIHLPLESKYYSRPEEDTLNISDPIEVVEKRIKKIKEWFPQIVYYNNHTGGSFTADYNAMDRLIRTMKENGLIFVDSRTIGNSKAPEITKKYGMFLYSRDVFLDNSLEKSLIKNQLKEAVSKAHKYGYAIAIGHPHRNTLEVLRESKELLKSVDMVYVKDL